MKRATNRSDARRRRLIYLLSVVVAASMVGSLVIALIPDRPAPATAAEPTTPALWTPSPVPPTQTPQPTATPTLEATATVTPLPREETGLPWSFAVMGASWGLDDTARATLAALHDGGDLFILHTGNMTASGTQAEFEAWHQHCRNLNLTLYPVPGNRDNSDGSLVAYGAFSGAPAQHYSFDRGALHVSVVNASLGELSEGELAWLSADLAATDGDLRVVAMHYPPVDPTGESEVLKSGAEEFLTLAVAQGVDAVFSGRSESAVDVVIEGVRFVAPGALSSSPGTEQPASPQYLRVTVDGASLSFEAVPVTAPAP